MDVYGELGVKKLINAWGPMTLVGGSRMRPKRSRPNFLMKSGTAKLDCLPNGTFMSE